MDGDGKETEHGVGRGMLPQQAALVHIRQQPENKGGTDTDTQGLVRSKTPGHGKQSPVPRQHAPGRPCSAPY